MFVSPRAAQLIPFSCPFPPPPKIVCSFRGFVRAPFEGLLPKLLAPALRQCIPDLDLFVDTASEDSVPYHRETL